LTGYVAIPFPLPSLSSLLSSLPLSSSLASPSFFLPTSFSHAQEAQGSYAVPYSTGYWVEASALTKEKFIFPGDKPMTVNLNLYRCTTKENKILLERTKIQAQRAQAELAARIQERRGSQVGKFRDRNFEADVARDGEGDMPEEVEERRKEREKSAQEMLGMQRYVDDANFATTFFVIEPM
jgi:hypothetical protein